MNINITGGRSTGKADRGWAGISKNSLTGWVGETTAFSHHKLQQNYQLPMNNFSVSPAKQCPTHGGYIYLVQSPDRAWLLSKVG